MKKKIESNILIEYSIVIIFNFRRFAFRRLCEGLANCFE